jgi:ribosomal protein S18 acetylase RimI-like enzyme
MAALPDRYTDCPPRGALIDLRDLQPEHLGPLIEEEIEAWNSGLDWDFRMSADLVKRFVQVRALNGFALLEGGVRSATVAGYCYYVAEEGKGLIGDFYIRQSARTLENENRLLEAVLDSMWKTPGMRRVEAQMLMLSGHLNRPMPFPRWCKMFPRGFFESPVRVGALPPREPAGSNILPWIANMSEEAARLIATSYRGHVDSQINDQYRSSAGAHRFLANIVQFPGCGQFFAPASFAARDRSTGSLCGISLASLVAPNVGHITQLCVAPSHQGRGVGYELLRRSLESLASNGCHSASLTATCANQAAVRLYESVGFRSRRDFAAFVWELGSN